ncbi:ferrochelatase [Desulfurispirillum indicum]|uniref:ferrochelatase n=1 Tax=Desulfurispirillum indicum TaxID=936456 RepID=UPI001CFB8664|nr:ferrochelatase [Desulfurispirillum indicum]UCZ57434.1 ferrochelatase [Desulfurispirillum indicum]
MKTGVVLLNMGGPSSLEQVLPFLTGLFNDPRILGIRNGLVRKALASYIISRRLPTAISHYELIGGRSPLLEHTEKLAPKVEQELAQLGIEAMVAAGMRYLEPRTPATVQQLVEKGCSRIVGFSMYPHYSLSTTGSSVEDFQQATQDIQGVQTHLVESYPDERFYIAAMRQKIDQALQKCQHKPLLLFCAHSLPEKLIRSGDPYRDHIYRTVQALLEFYPDYAHDVVFQSRATRGKWLEPDIDHRLPELVDEGHENMLVVPVSFTCDNVETVYELEMEHRELAGVVGVKEYAVVECLNDSDLFAHAIAHMISRELHHD